MMMVPLAVPVGRAWLKVAVRSGIPGHATFTDVQVAPLVAPPGHVADPNTVTVPTCRTFGRRSEACPKAGTVVNPASNRAVSKKRCDRRTGAGFIGDSFVLRSLVGGRRSKASDKDPAGGGSNSDGIGDSCQGEGICMLEPPAAG